MDTELRTISGADDDDFEFSYHVKKAAEGDLIRKTFGWDEAFQRDFHRKDWTKKRPSIIKYDDEPIGTVAVTESAGQIEIGQFFILPEYQSRGIGTIVLQRALQKADEIGAVTTLAFLKGNRAESLYQRNGFQLIAQTETHSFMNRKPRNANRPPA